ncbi:MAG: hypothetical protein MJE68_29720, partial [Proteobacteria bacterium]|nr:hypothetical protein [Pseudomonadota bacterium]
LQMLSKTPGTAFYMPPEALQDMPRYDTQLDVFSFGHLALYALVEEFPTVLPSTYDDPVTRDLRARTEVERREKYIAKLYKRLTEEHTVTKMTIRCLHNLPEERYTYVIKYIYRKGIS